VGLLSGSGGLIVERHEVCDQVGVFAVCGSWHCVGGDARRGVAPGRFASRRLPQQEDRSRRGLRHFRRRPHLEDKLQNVLVWVAVLWVDVLWYAGVVVRVRHRSKRSSHNGIR
jgi:hypothetical protein